MVFVFCSTSKISYPDSGLAAMGASFHNIQNIKMQMAVQTIGNDKMNQLRHVRFFGNKQGVLEHMKKHAELIRPKFQLVERILEEELGFCGIARWTNPKGGYFISLDTQPGCAKRVISLCRQAGVAMTPAGSTYLTEWIRRIPTSELRQPIPHWKNWSLQRKFSVCASKSRLSKR